MRKYFFSFFYKISRFTITRFIFFLQAILNKQRDLETAVIFGDKGISFLSKSTPNIFQFNLPKNKSVELFGLKFPTPIVSASFKSDFNIINSWLMLGLGGVTLKTILKSKRIGNPRPRLQEIKLNNKIGIYNSLGLPGEGIKELSKNLIESKLWEYKRPIGISIGGDDIDEYHQNIKIINRSLLKNKNYFFELNISCPNTTDGKSIEQNPKKLEQLLNNIRKDINTPISVKVSPDSEIKNYFSIGEIVKGFSRVFINAGNSHFMKASKLGLDSDQFSMNGGGVSGSPIFKNTIRIVKIFSELKVKTMATGGISSIDHVNHAKENGAILFGIASALVMDPFCIPIINSKL